jgi:hypothetical protein
MQKPANLLKTITTSNPMSDEYIHTKKEDDGAGQKINSLLVVGMQK